MPNTGLSPSSHLSLVLKSQQQGCREASWNTCNAEPVHFFSTEASTKFSVRFEEAHGLRKASYRGWGHVSGCERPGINSLLNLRRFKTKTLASLQGALTLVCVLLWTRVERVDIGTISSTGTGTLWRKEQKSDRVGSRTRSRRMCKSGGSPSSYGSYLSSGPSKVKMHQEGWRWNLRTSPYWCKQGWKILLYRLWMDWRQYRPCLCSLKLQELTTVKMFYIHIIVIVQIH